MIALNILHLQNGHSVETLTASPSDLDMENSGEIVAPLQIRFEIEKVGIEHYIQATFEAKAKFVCDRCAEDFTGTIKDSVRIIFTRDEQLLDQDDVYKISDGTIQVDVTESIKESLSLAFPVKRLCSQDCKGLCVKCGTNLNRELCRCDQTTADPRWDKLRNLITEQDRG